METKTEISRRHFSVEGERIKVQDRKAIYEIREPKDLAMQEDFGFVRYAIVLNLVDKYCAAEGGSHLDLGCGLGYLMAKMAQKRFKTSGVDISRSFLDIAEEKLKYRELSFEKLVEADLQKEINLPDASFDVITSTDVLEHIEKPEMLLKHIRRLLKPTGKAIICTNNSLSIWGLEKFIKERTMRRRCFHPIDNWWNHFTLKKFLEKNGFRILETRGTYFLPLVKFKFIFSLFRLYEKRYEINNWLSSSVFKYFGRDIIFVLEKI